MQVGLEERVDSLEAILGHFMVSTSVALTRMERGIQELKDEMIVFKEEMGAFKDEMGAFKDEMGAFKDEMGAFKDEMGAFKREAELDRKEMNRKWGDLANKMGTVVEDIVAPNIPAVAAQYFHCPELEFFGVRVRKRNASDRSLRREFDVVAVSHKLLIINETKSKPDMQSVREFVASLGEISSYFPEYPGRTLVPIFASLYMSEEVVSFLTSNRVYAMTMKGNSMDLVNFGDFEP